MSDARMFGVSGPATKEVAPGLHRGGRRPSPVQSAFDAGIPVARRREPGLYRANPKKVNAVANVAALEPLRFVDIYLSAGPHDNYGFPMPVNYRSCNQDDTANCTLYRVRWDHQTNTGVVTVVERATSVSIGAATLDVGYVQPAVSPDGRWLLYIAVATLQDGSGRHAISSSIVLNRPKGGAHATLYTRAAGANQPQYPAWLGDYVPDPTSIWDTSSGVPYLWNSATGAGAFDTATVWKHFDMGFLNLDLPVLGPGGLSTATQQTSFEDGNVHQNVADRGGPGLVTFGGAISPPTPTEHIPQVSDLDGGNLVQVDIASSTPALTECHHPAFNKSGDAILCTGQEPAEDFGILDSGSLQHRRRLHSFSWNGAAWADGAPLVGALSAADFESIATDKAGNVLPGVFPEQALPGSLDKCRNYVWKFAEYCGSDRYVVATVYCTDSSDSPQYRQIRNSRVVLIDLDADDDIVGTPAAYHDLTGWIEDFESAQAGTFNAVFSTCRQFGSVL